MEFGTLCNLKSNPWKTNIKLQLAIIKTVTLVYTLAKHLTAQNLTKNSPFGPIWNTATSVINTNSHQNDLKIDIFVVFLFVFDSLRFLTMQSPYSVKLNDFALLCFHRACLYNEVWGRVLI